MKCVIFDIDGTLSDPSHRLHHVSGHNRNWDDFFAAMGGDGCHEPIVDLLHALKMDNLIILCSGRPETYRDVTEQWLKQFVGRVWSELYMRPAGDNRPDYIVKAEMLKVMKEDGFEPWLVIDDRPSVVEMWREAGLTCLQCRDWDERSPDSIPPGLLTLMVGPSGAGKTTWLHSAAAKDYGIHPSHIVSSDRIRIDLTGDMMRQDRNDDVFAALHAVVKARIRAGLPTVVDATNLRDRDRRTVVALAPHDGPIRYMVIDRPTADKRRDGGWRNTLKDAKGEPFDLLAKHEQTFRSNLKNILAGDALPNVTVIDLRVSQ